MNLNWWTDFDYLQRDKSLKFHFAKKVVFVPIPTISVLHAIQEQFNRFSFILVHEFHASFTVQNCIGSRKKLLESGFAIFSRNSSAKVLVMHENKEKKINGMTMHFFSRATA